MSVHTGRLHIYAGEKDGEEERRRHLGVNLRPEEVQEAVDRMTPPGSSTDHPSNPDATPVEKCHVAEWIGPPGGTEWFGKSHWAAAERFLREWGELRKVYQRKLVGRALSLPLGANLVGMGTEHMSSQGVVRGAGGE